MKTIALLDAHAVPSGLIAAWEPAPRFTIPVPYVHGRLAAGSTTTSMKHGLLDDARKIHINFIQRHYMECPSRGRFNA